MLAIVLTGSAAMADEAQMHINLAGVNVNSEAGAQLALSRIRAEAQQFCEGGSRRTTLDRSLLIAACEQKMTQSAVAQVASPHLSALYGAPAKPPMAFARR